MEEAKPDKPDRFEALTRSNKQPSQRNMLTERLSSHGAMLTREFSRLSAHGNVVPAEGKRDEERIILGTNLSTSMFRGASIKFINELDLSRGHDAAIHSSGTFIYDVDKIEPVIAESNLHVNIAEAGNVVEICEGSNSVISKANFDGQGVILKLVQEHKAHNPKVITEFMREIQIMSRLRHPNITGLLGAGSTTQNRQVMPFVLLERLDGGTLTAKLRDKRKAFGKPFPFGLYVSYCTQLASALKYLHMDWSPHAAIIHRDLKPDNIGFTANGTLKLMDFGLCVCITRRKTATETYVMTGCTGSLRYMAVEVAANEPYNEKVDIYSFGIISYEMYVGVAPFGGMNRESFLERVVEKGERPDLVLDDYGRKVNADPDVSRVLGLCWDKDHQNRPSADHLYEEFNTILARAGSPEESKGLLSRIAGSLFGSSRK